MKFADYGFQRQDDAPKPDRGDKPIRPFNCGTLMAELARMPLGPNGANRTWYDLTEWGQGPGAVRVEISPLGSYKATIRRQVQDLEGETAWVCKQVFPLGNESHNEVSLAHEIFGQLREISGQLLDGPQAKHPNFPHLARELASEVQRNYPGRFMFPVGTAVQSQDYYKVMFEYKGQGVEAPGGLRTERFDIDLAWDPRRGLTRCWGYEIASPVGRHEWRVMPSDFDEWFAPNQPADEVVACVSKLFNTY